MTDITKWLRNRQSTLHLRSEFNDLVMWEGRTVRPHTPSTIVVHIKRTHILSSHLREYIALNVNDYGHLPSINGYGSLLNVNVYGHLPSINGYGRLLNVNGYDHPPGINGYAFPPSISGYGHPPSTSGYGRFLKA